jgi:hypothetical protein
MNKSESVAWAVFVWPLFAWAQAVSPPSTPARMVITVCPSYKYDRATITRNDLIVMQRQYGPATVTNLIPLRGDRAGLELFLLVDNCSNCELGSKLEELRRFIGSQPSTTEVGIAYIDNGHLKVVENPTQDRDCAVKALKGPTGNMPSNPYGALIELIERCPQNSSRHVVLMISNGIDPAAPDPLQDTTAEAAIEAAQRAGVTVYAVYHPSADYLISDSSKMYSGQLQLSHIAYETGGAAYFLGLEPVATLAPFLADVADHLANQYLLEFLAKPIEGPGRLLPVTVQCKVHDLDLMAPDSVWVTGFESDAQAAKDKELHRSQGERP